MLHTCLLLLLCDGLNFVFLRLIRLCRRDFYSAQKKVIKNWKLIRCLFFSPFFFFFRAIFKFHSLQTHQNTSSKFTTHNGCYYLQLLNEKKITKLNQTNSNEIRKFVCNAHDL